MTTFKKIGIGILALCLQACEPNVAIPASDFIITNPAGEPIAGATQGEPVFFKPVQKDATYYVVWTGDPTHVYANRHGENPGPYGVNPTSNAKLYDLGVQLDESLTHTYVYKTPGTYQVVMVATTVADGKTFRAVASKEITISE